MSDLISRQDAIDDAREMFKKNPTMAIRVMDLIKSMPSAQSDLIRCKDCKWWDKYSDRNGYCHAAKHGYVSGHWEIGIYRTYKEDFYCADAEPKEEQE